MKIKTIADLEPIINDIQLHLGLSGRTSFVENYRGKGLDTYKLTNGLVRFNNKPQNLLKRERKLFEKYILKVKSGSFDFIQEPYHLAKHKFLLERFQPRLVFIHSQKVIVTFKRPAWETWLTLVLE